MALVLTRRVGESVVIRATAAAVGEFRVEDWEPGRGARLSFRAGRELVFARAELPQFDLDRTAKMRSVQEWSSQRAQGWPLLSWRRTPAGGLEADAVVGSFQVVPSGGQWLLRWSQDIEVLDRGGPYRGSDEACAAAQKWHDSRLARFAPRARDESGPPEAG